MFYSLMYSPLFLTMHAHDNQKVSQFDMILILLYICEHCAASHVSFFMQLFETAGCNGSDVSNVYYETWRLTDNLCSYMVSTLTVLSQDREPPGESELSV